MQIVFTVQNGYTPLHIAARRNNLTIARLLLEEQSVNPNSKSKV